MNIKLKSIIGIITVKDDKLSLALDGKSLIKLDVSDDIDKVNSEYLKKIAKNMPHLKQAHTFCEKNENNMNISIVYYGIINYRDVDSNLSVVPIEEFSSNKYVKSILECLNEDFSYISTIRKLYPDEFKLPVIQRLYEVITGKQYDRRNFRKKLLKLGIIEDLHRYSTNTTGRPAKLYKFKVDNDIDNRIWF